jgi:hypothetical protein
LDEHALHNLDWDSIIKELGLHDDPGLALKTLHQFNHPCSDPQLVHHHLIPYLPHSDQPFDATQFVHSDFNLSEIYSSSHNHLAHHHNLNSFDLAHDFHHIGLNGRYWNASTHGFDPRSESRPINKKRR